MSRFSLALVCAALLLAGCDSPGPVTTVPGLTLSVRAGSGQEGLPGVPLPAPVAVRATRADGTPAAGVAVRWQAGPGAGSLEVLESVTGTDGVARARWHLPPQPGAALTATAAVDGAAEAVFTAAWLPRGRADLLLGPAGRYVRLLLHAPGTVDTAGAFTTAFRDSLAILPFADPGRRGSVIAFAEGHPPVFRPVSWTGARDTLRLEFPPPVRVPLTIWIIRAPFDSIVPRMRAQAEQARGTWALAGVDLGDVRIVDATGHPNAGLFQDTTRACGTERSLIGYDEGRTNIYVTGVVVADGKSVGGYGCSMDHVNISVTAIGAMQLLGHELGHTFGLAHQPGPNLMDPNGNFGGLTLGQIFRVHVSSASAVPGRYGGAGLPMADCTFVNRCLPALFDMM